MFDYAKWLEDLKVGSPIRIAHGSRCDCVKLEINGKVEYNGEIALAVFQDCNVRHFSVLNGRELGNRKGNYKDRYIMPWTEEDEKRLAEKNEVDRRRKQSEKLKQRFYNVMNLLASDNTAENTTVNLCRSISDKNLKVLVDICEKEFL